MPRLNSIAWLGTAFLIGSATGFFYAEYRHIDLNAEGEAASAQVHLIEHMALAHAIDNQNFDFARNYLIQLIQSDIGKSKKYLYALRSSESKVTMRRNIEAAEKLVGKK